MTSTTSLSSQPGPDEIEISVFGPGVGECVVVHCGDNEWIVVDSHLHNGEPVALWYLKQLGVSPERVRHVVVTHWHTDHIRGVGALYEKTTKALVHCSSALNGKEFKSLLKAGRTPHVDLGTSELEALLKVRQARRTRGLGAGLSWLQERTIVFRGRAVEVVALSPSPATISLALQELAQLIPDGGPKRNIVAQSANQVAVVLSVRCLLPHGKQVILGSDLEVVTPTTGWHAVVASAQSLGLGQSSIYKVAHHGSETAHDANVLRLLVARDAHCVVTPYQPSRLPSEADKRRLQSHSPHLYQTASDAGVKPLRHDLERAVRLAVRNRRVLASKMGHVRLRVPPDGVVRSDLFGTAVRCPESVS